MWTNSNGWEACDLERLGNDYLDYLPSWQLSQIHITRGSLSMLVTILLRDDTNFEILNGPFDDATTKLFGHYYPLY